MVKRLRLLLIVLFIALGLTGCRLDEPAASSVEYTPGFKVVTVVKPVLSATPTGGPTKKTTGTPGTLPPGTPGAGTPGTPGTPAALTGTPGTPPPGTPPPGTPMPGTPGTPGTPGAGTPPPPAASPTITKTPGPSATPLPPTHTPLPSPTQTFTHTPGPSPTPLPTATRTVTPTPPPLACTGISASPANISKGADFDEHFSVKNTGSKSWTSADTVYKYISGDKFQKRDSYAMPKEIKNGEVADLIIDMIAPQTEGSYHMVWAVAQGTTNICQVTIKISVR